MFSNPKTFKLKDSLNKSPYGIKRKQNQNNQRQSLGSLTAAKNENSSFMRLRRSQQTFSVPETYSVDIIQDDNDGLAEQKDHDKEEPKIGLDK